jgi:hypothetical protein
MNDVVAGAQNRDDQPTEVLPPLPPDPDPDRERPKRRRLIVFGAVVGCVLAGAATAIVLHGQTSAPVTTQPPPEYFTRVVRTDLADTQSVPGAIGYGTAQTVRAAGGTVTWLPSTGTVVSRDQQLLRIDDQPVFLFYGATPLFRDLDTPNLVGRDVRVVADNLSALGYAIGAQPKVGTMISPVTADPAGGAVPTTSAPPPTQQSALVRVHDGDAVLTPALIAAITHWQRDTGQLQTGVLSARNVIVLSGPVRVGDVSGQLGGPATASLLSVTGTTKVVTVSIDPSAVGPVHQGDPVSLQLPDGRTVPGTVTDVSTASATDSGGGSGGGTGTGSGSGGSGSSGSTTVTVTPGDPTSVAGLDNGGVQVAFTTASRDGVLAVPVGALLAVREGGYAVQVPGRGLVPVTTGMFARGMVQISGPGIVAGTVVVTTP